MNTKKIISSEFVNIMIVIGLMFIMAASGALLAKADSSNMQQKYEQEQELNFYKSANEYKHELLELQHKALEQADSIIEKNNLYDVDGSDEMSEYLELKAKIEELLSQEI